MAKYRLDSTEARTDGSGEIAFDIWALDDGDLVIPGKHVTVLVPYDEVVTALASGNPAAALKAALVAHAPAGWDSSTLDDAVAANENAATVDVALDAFVDGVGGYPVSFSL